MHLDALQVSYPAKPFGFFKIYRNMHLPKSVSRRLPFLALLGSLSVLAQSGCSNIEGKPETPTVVPAAPPTATGPMLDTADYDCRLTDLTAADTSGRWTAIQAPHPLPGAILPFQRVVAYYGNFYSKRMGILGELPPHEMLAKLQAEAKKWELADPATPVLPAIHYIAVTAQQAPGRDGKYRMRMPKAQIEKALSLAAEIDAIVFLDVQVGWSTLQEELPALDTFLALPNVHLGIDPEFSMKNDVRPGKRIGTFDAADVNFAAEHLAQLVKIHQLPPKILVVHRFTGPMLTGHADIQPLPEVQIVIEMDGWGGKAYKQATYRQVIYPEPVQFTGFKVFYHHDTRKVGEAVELQPAEILELVPKPIYIQYQ